MLNVGVVQMAEYDILYLCGCEFAIGGRLCHDLMTAVFNCTGLVYVDVSAIGRYDPLMRAEQGIDDQGVRLRAADQ